MKNIKNEIELTSSSERLKAEDVLQESANL